MSAPLPLLTTAMLDESWCPIYTPFWLHEAAGFVDLHSIDVLDRLGLFMLGADMEDPSVRTSRLSFWTILSLRVHKELGTEEFTRMVEDDTLVLWEDHLEACLTQQFGGLMSVGAALSVTRTCAPEPSLIAVRDWKMLCRAFRSSAIWAAGVLLHHRQLWEKALARTDKEGQARPVFRAAGHASPRRPCGSRPE